MRIISLLPGASETVAALGAADALVGVTHECDFPASLRSISRVTSTTVNPQATPAAIDAQVRALAGVGRPIFTLDETRIGQLRPDIILTQALCEVCAVSETDVRALALRLTPQPAVVALSATTFDGVLNDIAIVGEALGIGQRAQQLIGDLQVRVRHVHEQLKAAQAPRKPVAVIEWTDPVFAAGHWTPEIIRRAGGTDVLAQAGESLRHGLRVDYVQSCDPAVLIISPCGYDLAGAAREGRLLLERPEWAWVRARDVWALDANALLSRPGPRLSDAVETLACILTPGLFGGPNTELALALS